jgi:hypothetical protein
MATAPLRSVILATLALTVMLAGGCVKRTLRITSEPSGALVWLNDHEVGRTPLEVGFVYYGTYDVRLEREGCEPLLTVGQVNPPLWDMIGPDFVAEVIPVQLESNASLHYEMQPRKDDPVELLERARQLRGRIEPVPAAEPEAEPEAGPEPEAEGRQ